MATFITYCKNFISLGKPRFWNGAIGSIPGDELVRLLETLRAKSKIVERAHADRLFTSIRDDEADEQTIAPNRISEKNFMNSG